MNAARRYVDHRALINSALKEVDDLTVFANTQTDLVAQGYLLRLATVRLSGFVEQAVGHMVRGYLSEHTSPRVLRFSTRQAGQMTNLNPAKLVQLIGSFDDEWRETLEDFLDQDENRQTLGNLINARHKFAHGDTAKVNPALLRDYREVAVKVVDLLLNLLLPVATRN